METRKELLDSEVHGDVVKDKELLKACDEFLLADNPMWEKQEVLNFMDNGIMDLGIPYPVIEDVQTTILHLKSGMYGDL